MNRSPANHQSRRAMASPKPSRSPSPSCRYWWTLASSISQYRWTSRFRNLAMAPSVSLESAGSIPCSSISNVPHGKGRPLALSGAQAMDPWTAGLRIDRGPVWNLIHHSRLALYTIPRYPRLEEIGHGQDQYRPRRSAGPRGTSAVPVPLEARARPLGAHRTAEERAPAGSPLATRPCEVGRGPCRA